MTKIKPNLMGAAAMLALIMAPTAMAWEGGPSPIIIDQVQLGQTIADLYVQVPEHADSASAVSTAMGNSGSGTLMGGDIDYDAFQTNEGDVSASTALTGGNVAGAATASTTAYGNASTGGTWMGNSYYRAEQTMNGDTSASTGINLGNADTVNSTTTAAANVSVSSSEYGDNSAFQIQNANGNVSASTSAVVCCTNTSGSFATTASGNVASSSGSTSTSINGAVQSTSADTNITATSSVYMSDGNDIASHTTATGNSYVLQNEWGYASLGRQGSELFQGNVADVKGESFLELDHWSGSATSSAYGVGNSALVSNVGSDTALNAQQANYGEVVTNVNLVGNSYQGGAGYAVATSIGNAATGILCNVCGDGVLNGNVSQFNAGNVSANTVTYVPYAGHVSGSATAVGNSATFTSKGD